MQVNLGNATVEAERDELMRRIVPLEIVGLAWKHPENSDLIAISQRGMSKLAQQYLASMPNSQARRLVQVSEAAALKTKAAPTG